MVGKYRSVFLIVMIIIFSLTNISCNNRKSSKLRILVTPKAEVLNWDQKIIPGLYAAGLMMEGSLSGGVENSEGAYAGCIAAGLIFGILAAENAVKA